MHKLGPELFGRLTGGLTLDYSKYAEAYTVPDGQFDCSRMLDGSHEPEPAECVFCGRKLRYERMELEDGSFLCWNAEPERCTCEQSRAWWEELIAREREQAAEEEMRKKAALHQQLLENAIGRSGLPPASRRTFDTFVPETPDLLRSLELCRGYAEMFPERLSLGQGMILQGNVGTGKTHLAASVALHIMDRGLGSVIWREEAQVMLDFRSAYGRGPSAGSAQKSEKDVLQAYLSCDLLVLDDVGKDRETEWSISKLFSVLNGRYELGRPTVITTNLDRDEMSRKFAHAEQGGQGSGGWTAAAIMSRLGDAERFLTVHVQGRDYRTKPGMPSWARDVLRGA